MERLGTFIFSMLLRSSKAEAIQQLGAFSWRPKAPRPASRGNTTLSAPTRRRHFS